MGSILDSTSIANRLLPRSGCIGSEHAVNKDIQLIISPYTEYLKHFIEWFVFKFTFRLNINHLIDRGVDKVVPPYS